MSTATEGSSPSVGEPLPPGSRRQDDEPTTMLLRERLPTITLRSPPPSRWQPGRWLSRLT